MAFRMAFGWICNSLPSRYTQCVTLNGANINSGQSVGYGAWRLEESQFEQLVKTRIGSNFISNVQKGCGDIGIDGTTPLQDIMDMANENPCLSAVSLLTYLELNGDYPVKNDIDYQEQLMYGITDQVQIPWDDMLDLELDIIAGMCFSLIML